RREFDASRGLNKRLFGLIIEPDLTVAKLPPELTATWQTVNLAAGNDLEQFRASLPDLSREEFFYLSRSGLALLRAGLDKAGLDPRFFAWPPDGQPDRPPYPGLRP